MDIATALSGRINLDVDQNDLITDAVVIVRVAPDSGEHRSAIDIACTEGTDGIVQSGLLSAANAIAHRDWARHDEE